MKYSIHDHTVFASVFLLAVSRRKKQRDTSNRSGWPLCFRESSKITKSHSNLCCPFASALGFPFFQFPALSSFLLFFILLLLSVLSIVSTFSSFTFYVTNTKIFSLLLVIYLSCSLSLSPSRPLSVILLVRLSRSFALSLFSEGRQMGISQTAALFFPCFSCSSLH